MKTLLATTKPPAREARRKTLLRHTENIWSGPSINDNSSWKGDFLPRLCHSDALPSNFQVPFYKKCLPLKVSKTTLFAGLEEGGMYHLATVVWPSFEHPRGGS